MTNMPAFRLDGEEMCIEPLAHFSSGRAVATFIVVQQRLDIDSRILLHQDSFP